MADRANAGIPCRIRSAVVTGLLGYRAAIVLQLGDDDPVEKLGPWRALESDAEHDAARTMAAIQQAYGTLS